MCVYWSVETERASIAVDGQRNQQGLRVGLWWGVGGGGGVDVKKKSQATLQEIPALTGEAILF